MLIWFTAPSTRRHRRQHDVDAVPDECVAADTQELIANVIYFAYPSPSFLCCRRIELRAFLFRDMRFAA